MSDKKVKVAVIGLGMGMEHLERYSKNPMAEVVGLCDLNEIYARSTAEKFGVPFVTTDYRGLLSKADLDAVSIATPVHLHHKMTIDALEAGKHVLVEKPMAHTLDQAREMAATAEKTGKILTVHHNRRYDAVTQYIKKLIDEDALGKVYFIRTGWRRSMASMTQPTVERDGQIFDKSWFTQKDKGGGVLFDLGTHMLDRSMYLLGFPSVSSAMCSTYNEVGKLQEVATGYKFDAEDFATGLVRFDDDVTLQLEVSFGSYIEEDLVYTHIYGSRGGVSEKCGNVKLIESSHGATKISDISSIPVPQIANPADDFISAIAENRSPMVTVDQSVKVMGLLQNLRDSSDFPAGTPVNISSSESVLPGTRELALEKSL